MTPTPVRSSAATACSIACTCTSGSRTIPPLPTISLARLELRLDQKNPVGVPGPEGADLWSNERQRNEGEIGDHDIERSPERNGIGVTDVCSFHDNNPGVGANPMVELTVSDVESDHFAGSALQEAVGEPSGRCSDVDRPSTFDRHAKGLDCAVELRSGATDESRGRAFNGEWILRGHERRRLRRRVPSHANPPGVDHPAGFAA